MANYTTGAQRYNARMDKIWEKAKALEAARTMAQKIEADIHWKKMWPICCPFNVAQVSNYGAWVAIMPDNSVIFCDYEHKTTRCFNRLPEEDTWDFMHKTLETCTNF